MAEAAQRGPDPGASPGGRPGSGGDPREAGRSRETSLEESWVLLPEAESPPPDKVVSPLPDPAARELLKAKVLEAKAFTYLLLEREYLQTSHETEVGHLKAEIHRLLQELQEQAHAPQEEAQLRTGNQQPQQELQEARRSQRAGKLTWVLPWFKRDFHIQVRVTGKTGGCESQFIKKVSDRLPNRINLKVESYPEGSGCFLLIFCPVATSVASDMGNALEGLGSEPKAVLVMLHHKLKESTSSVDTRKHAQHPAVVRTVHARYALEEGFYTCPMNEEAVDIVAEVLKDHC